MASKQSVSNNCNRPLSAGSSFTGAWESSAGALVLGVFVASPTLGYCTIQQSNNRGVSIQLTDTFNVDAGLLDAMTVFRVPSGFSWFRVSFHNSEGDQTYLSLNTYLESSYTAPTTIAGDVVVSGTVAVSSVAGVVDISGNVVSTLPTLSYDQSAVGSLIAPQQLIGCKIMGTVSTLTGEEKWCNDGGALPVFGTVSIDSGNNTVKLDPLNATVTINDGSLPLTVSIVGAGNTVQLDPASSLPTGANTIGLLGIDTANNIVRIDDGTLPLPITIDSGGNTVKIDPASSLPAGTNVIGTVIVNDGTSSIIVTSISNPLPTGSNTLGVVGIDPAINIIKIDQATTGANGVKVNPTAQPPVRITGLGDTAKSIGGPGLLYGASYQNKSAVVNCWVKLYDSVGAPTAGDTPFVIQYLESVQQYNLTSANDNFFNTPIANTLWARATLLPADNDITDTGIDAELTCFVGT
jgi:hypothetical protein